MRRRKHKRILSKLKRSFTWMKAQLSKGWFKTVAIALIIAALVVTGATILWVSSLDVPDVTTFEQRKIAESTKIFDSTGEVVLFDVHGDIKRTVVSEEEISAHLRNATVAIEDEDFYTHNGVQFSAIIRAILTNLKDGNLLSGQGGSTITQQVLKNALLTSDKKVSRKIKEWVLAPQLEELMTKDEILTIYLNEVSYGGNTYGVQEATERFFNKDAIEVTVAEAAYLAALPQAPSRYSPYGGDTEKLEKRKNKVLRNMLKHQYITEEEYATAIAEEVEFQEQNESGIRAPHFVMYVREQLEEKYGKEAVEEEGLTVITSLDWKLQEEAERIAKEWGTVNTEKFNATNNSIIAVDPQTGHILTMVGSRDYFDEEIDGNFNVALAMRQPGSTFKPIVYAEAFAKGYRPETIVFDLETEFSTSCADDDACYTPGNYDDKFRGPISLRAALAQSVNIPAVKALYLAGLSDSVDLAKRMGISTLGSWKDYGLTLVLGGGEVTPLDMTTAYGVFANDGVRNDHVSILRVEDKEGNILEEFEQDSKRVLDAQTSRQVSDVLSDDAARAPAFGWNSRLHVPYQDVAVKTGTTNDYRDMWIIGYSPNIVVTTWVGNNDNTPITKNIAGFVVAPMWREYVDFALKEREVERFTPPAAGSFSVKPILRGDWQGITIGNSIQVEEIPDDVAEEEGIVMETGQEIVSAPSFEGYYPTGIHSILHFVDKRNPNGPVPTNPHFDGQYSLWEESVQKWAASQNLIPIDRSESANDNDETEKKDDEVKAKLIAITNPPTGSEFIVNSPIFVTISTSLSNIDSAEVFLNNKKAGDIDIQNKSFEITSEMTNDMTEALNVLTVSIKADGQTHTDTVVFSVK